MQPFPSLRTTAPVPGRYALRPFSTLGSVAWAPALVPYWRGLLGNTPDASLTIDLLCRSLRPSSSGSYGSKWRLFASFCAAAGLQALPAAPSTVLRYLGHLAALGRIQAANLQPYFSAINKIHVDLQLPPPARGQALASARRGLALAQREVAETTQRLPLPPGVALAVLWCGLHTIDDHVLRCCVCLVFNFMFGCRPATGAAMLASDITLSTDSFCLRLETEKQRSTVLERRVLHVPLSFFAGPLALWNRWVARRAALDSPIVASAALQSPFVDSYVWRLPSDRGPVRSHHLDLWFRDAAAATGFVSPAGFKFTGYAARKGMATAAKSIAVGMEEIQWLGGWAIGSSAVHSYIDLGVRPSLAAHLWFGWLLKRRDVSPPSLDFWLASAHEAHGLVSSAAGAPGADASPGAVVG